MYEITTIDACADAQYIEVKRFSSAWLLEDALDKSTSCYSGLRNILHTSLSKATRSKLKMPPEK